MNIHRTNGITVLLDMEGIDSVGYLVDTPTPAMLVHRTGGTVLTYPVAEIDSITYSPGGPEGTAPLATLPPASMSSGSALCAGVVSVGGAPVLSRGICYGLTPLPELSGPSMVAPGSVGSFQVELLGLQYGATYFARAFATNAQGTSYGNQVSFSTLPADHLAPDLTYGSMTDQDGNSYPTIIIGTQEWMAENLRAVTHANGDTIANVTDAGQWYVLSTGAWAHYNNDDQFDIPYGTHYNWYAVSDPRNVCPTGWHVPTDLEWQQLEIELGMTPDAAAAVGMVRGALENVGGRMKSAGTQYWLAQNAGGTNESGFSGLPSGGRNALGEFTQQGVLGIWWSATESDALSAYDRILLDGEAGVARNTADKRFGFPVRCLRD
jgi:uncharacterized protein (TIGR02145 family)